jgi:hypothetical protein
MAGSTRSRPAQRKDSSHPIPVTGECLFMAAHGSSWQQAEVPQDNGIRYASHLVTSRLKVLMQFFRRW